MGRDKIEENRRRGYEACPDCARVWADHLKQMALTRKRVLTAFKKGQHPYEHRPGSEPRENNIGE